MAVGPAEDEGVEPDRVGRYPIANYRRGEHRDMDATVELARRVLDPSTHAEFERRVERQARELTADFRRGALDSHGFATGLEVELYAVDEDGRLARVPRSTFEETGYSKEFGRHNVELNTPPAAFDAAGIDTQASAIREKLETVRRTVKPHGLRPVCDGMWTIPPAEGSLTYLSSVTETEGLAIADNMSADPRYYAIDNHVLAQCGGEIDLEIPGAHHTFPSILVESLTSSIQPHLQVPETAAFPRYYNLALRTLGPVLALATNSPFLPADMYTDVQDERRLVEETYHELRIPVFEGSVNVGSWKKACVPPDIESAVDVVDRLVDDETCAPFLAEWAREDASEPTEDEWCWELIHKYGTYWRWVRSVVGEEAGERADGRSLRIEYRPLPTQPSVADVIGLHCLTIGLIRGLGATEHPLVELDWTDARNAFYSAVHNGLDADLHWITEEGEHTTDPERIYPEVFEFARRGLREQGISDVEAERRLEPLAARWRGRTTPSAWKKRRVTTHLDAGLSLTDAIAAMQIDYFERSRTDGSFVEWD